MALVNGIGSVVKEDSLGLSSSIPVLPTGDSEVLSIFAETKFMDLAEYMGPQVDPTKIKFLTGVLLEMEETQPTYLQCSIGTKENINDTPVWNGPYSILVGEVFHVRLRTRYVALRVFDSLPENVWQMTAIELYGRAGRGGQRR
jgi:hypothetical protein